MPDLHFDAASGVSLPDTPAVLGYKLQFSERILFLWGDLFVVILAYSVVLATYGLWLWYVVVRAESRRLNVFIKVALVLPPWYVISRPLPNLIASWHGQDTALSLFFLAVFVVVSFFKTLEALTGLYPVGTNASVQSWLLYFVSTLEPAYGPGVEVGGIVAGRHENGKSGGNGGKPAPPKEGGVVSKDVGGGWKMLKPAPGSGTAQVKKLLTAAVCASVAFSLGSSNSFAPFPVKIANNVYQGLLVYLLLEFFSTLMALPLVAQGIRPIEVMRNPFFGSTSVRDLWGRRWNLVVHRLLSRLFFKPLASSNIRGGKSLGAIAAFLVSGLFHEYVWWFMILDHKLLHVGEVSQFFIIQFILCLSEGLLERKLPGGIVSRVKALPSPVKTLLTALAVFPFGHLFTDNMQRGQGFAQISDMFPHVTRSS